MTSIQAVKALKSMLREHLHWNGARLTFSAQFLLALFKVKTMNLAQLATALSGRAQIDSNYKRLQRFFRGFAVDQAVIARLVMRLLPDSRGERVSDAGPYLVEVWAREHQHPAAGHRLPGYCLSPVLGRAP